MPPRVCKIMAIIRRPLNRHCIASSVLHHVMPFSNGMLSEFCYWRVSYATNNVNLKRKENLKNILIMQTHRILLNSAGRQLKKWTKQIEFVEDDVRIRLTSRVAYNDVGGGECQKCGEIYEFVYCRKPPLKSQNRQIRYKSDE